MENYFSIKLNELRNRQRYSFQDIADAIGVSKQTIHKLESGQLSPSSDIILKIADFFNLKYSDFFKINDDVGDSFAKVRFRQGHSIFNQENFILEVKKKAIKHISIIFQLEKLLEVKRTFKNPLEDIVIENDQQVEKAAIILKKKWKIGTDAISDVVETLEDRGILVVEVDWDQQFTGLSAWISEILPLVIVNENCSTIERKRFTVLHELAHILLKFSSKLSDNAIEQLCDHFAGAVLFSEEAIFEELGKKRTSVSLPELRRIKEKYGISIQAIIFRARAVGYIDFKTFMEWNNAYNEWLKSNNKEDNFGHYKSSEKTTLLQKLLQISLAEKRISYSKAAEITGEKIDLLKKRMNTLNFEMKK